jgi:hypothetical protein
MATTREKYIQLNKKHNKLKKEFEIVNCLLQKEQRLNKRLNFEKRELQYLLHTSISLINDLSSDFNDKIV